MVFVCDCLLWISESKLFKEKWRTINDAANRTNDKNLKNKLFSDMYHSSRDRHIPMTVCLCNQIKLNKYTGIFVNFFCLFFSFHKVVVHSYHRIENQVPSVEHLNISAYVPCQPNKRWNDAQRNFGKYPRTVKMCIRRYFVYVISWISLFQGDEQFSLKKFRK